MIFSDFYKGARSPLARLRSGTTTRLPTDSPGWAAEKYANLLSKDKNKQKEAIRRYLADKVRDDWVFDWSPPHPELDQDPAQPVSKDDENIESVTLSPVANLQDNHDGSQVEHDDESESGSDAQSVYSIVSHDSRHYQPRDEWMSDWSDDSDDDGGYLHQDPQSCLDLAILARQAKRRRAIREEASWNMGLACFEARRNAWTGAKVVRVRCKPLAPASLPAVLPQSPRFPRRFFFRRSMSSSLPPLATIPATATTTANVTTADATTANVTTADATTANVTTADATTANVTTADVTTAATVATAELSGAVSDSSSVARDAHNLPKIDCQTDTNRAINTPATSAISTDETLTYPVETLVPLPQPILPPNNTLRASITPGVYIGLYEKVVLQNVQPSCPINLRDMLRSCVCGWKRDGEWPPGPTPPSLPHDRKRTTSSKPKKQSTCSEPPATAAAGTAYGADTKPSRRLSINLLHRDGGDESRAGKGLKRSLQRALGMGPAPDSEKKEG